MKYDNIIKLYEDNPVNTETLKTLYQYIHFKKAESKNYDWICYNNRSKDILGYIKYYDKWNENVFTQANTGVIFSTGCLKDISEFMKTLNEY